jgi:hypothetical protein
MLRTAFDSGRHFARAGLTPDWAALWVSGRLNEFSRGYEAGQLPQLSAEAAVAAAARGRAEQA